MAPPLRRRKSNEIQSEKDEDEEIEEVVAAEDIEDEEPLEEVLVNEESDSIDAEELLNALLESARTVVRTCMDIRRGENVLIVCDPTTSEIGQALHEAASERSDRVLLIVMPRGRHHGEEPPSPVGNLMRQQQVVIAPTKYSLTHTRAVQSARREGARVVTMPGMTVEMFTQGGISADFAQIKNSISQLNPYLRRRKMAQVTSESGTDVTFEANWREWKLDDNGICNRPKMITNLPAGKAFIMPKEGTMNGTIVIDGSWDASLVEEAIEFEVENGLVIDVKGGPLAATIRQQFGEAATRIRNRDRELVWTIAEFGFGMNPKARLIGNVLEDEKRLGTCYFSIGDNTSLGGNADVGIHIPGVIRKPSLWLDDTRILDEGTFLIGKE